MQRAAPILFGGVCRREKRTGGFRCVSEFSRLFPVLPDYPIGAVAPLCRLFRNAALSVKHRPAGAETFYPALHRPIASAAYRTRSVRPMRSVVVDLMPLRRQMFFTVVP